jgi:hypothetical protein
VLTAARTSRLAFFAYTATLASEVLLGLWMRHLIAAARSSQHLGDAIKRVELVGYGYMAIGAVSVVALLALAKAPRAALLSRVALGAAGAAGIVVALELARRLFLTFAMSRHADAFESVVHAFGVAMFLADTLARVLVVVMVARVGCAVGSRVTAPVAVAAFAALGVSLAMEVTFLALGDRAREADVLATAQTMVGYASTLLVGGASILAGAVVSRVADPPPTSKPALPGPLSPQWGAAAAGIGLYLGAVAARVLCALLGYAVMAGASGATSSSDLRGVRDSVLVCSVLSGVASLAMLTGVWRITRGPPDSGGPGPAMVTLFLMVLGLALDLATYSITLDALGGYLSAAFFAMDALPVIAGFSTLLGVGAGVALLRSFGNMAHALGNEDLRGRARSTTVLLVIAGTVAGGGALGLQHMPTEALVLLAVVVLPIAIAAAVQFLRVAVPLGRVIRSGLSSA